MNVFKKKTSLLHDNDAGEFDADNNLVDRLGGDIVLTGVTCRVAVSSLYHDDTELLADPELECGFATLDPVSQLLWSQSLRSLH